MERYVGRIWVAGLVVALAALVFFFRDSLTLIDARDGVSPLVTALGQLGILYIIALFVERLLEVLLKAWRQGGKFGLEQAVRSAEESARPEAERKLREYRSGTQRYALLVGLTLGTMVSLSGVRLLGRIFEPAAVQLPFQQGLFHFTDILLTAGLIAGGSASVHKLVTRIEDFLRTSRTRAPDG